MPDPMKNTDIEDVLSSIRRLVSYDPSNLRPPAPVAPAKPAQPERLVLTPALRVQATPEESAQVPPETVAPELSAPNVVPTPFAPAAAPAKPQVVAETAPPQATLEDRIADLEAAVSQAGEDWEPDGSEADANIYPTSYPVIEPPRRPRMHLAEPEAARRAAPEPEVAPQPQVAAAPESDVAQPAPEPDMTAAVPDMAVSDPQPAAESVAAPEVAAAAPQPAPAAPAVVAPPEMAAPDPQPVPPVPMAVTPAPESAVSAPQPAPAAVTAVPEVEIADAAETPLEEMAEDMALDAGVDDILLERAEEVVVAAAAAAPGADIDQANLREMVRQIVREEFQGALGERITRNVRKLVRREINRALVSKDFE